MSGSGERTERFNLAGAVEQAGIQYRANLWRLLPFGILAVLPPLGFLYSIPAGLALVLLLEGWFLMLLTEAARLGCREERPDLMGLLVRRHWHHIKNGTVIVLFILPLLTIGFVALIVPSVFFYSLFLFSFHHSTARDKFAIDACMESFRTGKGARLSLFFVSLFAYLAVGVFFIAAHLLSGGAGWLCVIPLAFFAPYYFILIEELYAQWESAA